MKETQEIEKLEAVKSFDDNVEDATYKHIVKYTGFFGGIQVLTILVSVIRNKLAVILLSKGGIGLTALYNNITGFLSNASNLGVSFSSIKHISEIYECGDMSKIKRHIEVVRTWSIWTAMMGMLLTILLSPIISWSAFDDFSHTVSVCMLSPVVAFMAITGGELAILKAVRKLHRVALTSIIGALFTLFLTIPFYYFWGNKGIIPALNVSTLSVMVAHLALSLPLFPWKVSLMSKEYFYEGWSLVKLGVPYILAAVINTFSVMGISFFINRAGSADDVGLYSMGFTLVITYAGIVFTAVDTDYFPRLSAIHTDAKRMSLTINRQVKVCVLLMAPFLVLFMLCMPLIIRLLYTAEYLPITGMAVCASLHMFFKAMTLPVAYTALAKADSLIYLLMEVIYDLVMVALVVIGYVLWGIQGTGVALALAGIFDFVLIYAVYTRRYDYKPDISATTFYFSQMICVIVAMCLGIYDDVMTKLLVGVPLICISVWLSVRVLRSEMTISENLLRRLSRNFICFRKK